MNKDYKTMRDNRLQANRQILELLSDYIEQNPDIRFQQALWNLNIITRTGYAKDKVLIEDRFYEESDITLDIIRKEHTRHGEIKKHD